MTSHYESSPANLHALRDRLTQAAKREGVVFGRVSSTCVSADDSKEARKS